MATVSLNEIKVYRLSMEIGKEVWTIVNKWNYFEKDTIGKQWVRSADSMAANIAEGYGRFHFKENRNFNFYSRGSMFESSVWMVKAHERGLISEDEFKRLSEKFKDLSVKLNNYLNSIGKKGIEKTGT